MPSAGTSGIASDAHDGVAAVVGQVLAAVAGRVGHLLHVRPRRHRAVGRQELAGMPGLRRQRGIGPGRVHDGVGLVHQHGAARCTRAPGRSHRPTRHRAGARPLSSVISLPRLTAQRLVGIHVLRRGRAGFEELERAAREGRAEVVEPCVQRVNNAVGQSAAPECEKPARGGLWYGLRAVRPRGLDALGDRCLLSSVAPSVADAYQAMASAPRSRLTGHLRLRHSSARFSDACGAAPTAPARAMGASACRVCPRPSRMSMQGEEPAVRAPLLSRAAEQQTRRG